HKPVSCYSRRHLTRHRMIIRCGMTTIVGKQALWFPCPIKVRSVKRNGDKFILFCQDHKQGCGRNQVEKSSCVKRCHIFDGAYGDSVVVGGKLPLRLLKPGEPIWAND